MLRQTPPEWRSLSASVRDDEAVVLLAGSAVLRAAWNALPLWNRGRSRMVEEPALGSDAPPAEAATEAEAARAARIVRLLQESGVRAAHLLAYGPDAELAVRLARDCPALVRSLVLVAWRPTGRRESDRRGADELPSPQPIEQIAQPVLLLNGYADGEQPEPVRRLLASRRPGVTLLVLPGSARGIMPSQPRLVAGWIAFFIRSANDREPAREAARDRLPRAVQAAGYPGRLEVRACGEFRLAVDGRPLSLGPNPPRNAKRLLLYLAMHAAPTRVRICEELWPNVPLGHARNSLRVSLFQLKKLLSGSDYPFLQADRERIYLNGSIGCDVRERMERMEAACRETNEERKRRLIADLLAETPAIPLDGFCDEWAADLATRFENRLLELADWLDGYCRRSHIALSGG